MEVEMIIEASQPNVHGLLISTAGNRMVVSLYEYALAYMRVIIPALF
jgi:hypothetical protein